jgi:hypothetical protein
MQCGHYTGYIRPFLGDKDPERADRWFCFDDDHVYSVPSKEAVESNFGGSGRPSRRAKSKRRKIVLDSDDKGGSENKMEDDDDEDYSDVFSLLPSSGGSSSCAYMLAYVRERDLDKVMNSSFLVPKNLEERIEKEILEEKERMRKIENERMMVDVAVWTDRHVCFLSSLSLSFHTRTHTHTHTDSRISKMLQKRTETKTHVRFCEI